MSYVKACRDINMTETEVFDVEAFLQNEETAGVPPITSSISLS